MYTDPDTGSDVVVEINEEMSEVTIGRNPGNIIRINNPSVSRRHTKFVYENGECTLYDLNSSNGTYVNGMRIQNQVLEDGDLVRVGEFPLEFVDEPGPVDTRVEGGDIAQEYKDDGMKSTHMGIGARGMEGAGDHGGAMAVGDAEQIGDVTQPPPGMTESPPGGQGGEPGEEFVLGEDDIEEVLEADETEAAEVDTAFDDATVDRDQKFASPDSGLQIGGDLDDADEDLLDSQTRRADDDTLKEAMGMEFDSQGNKKEDASELKAQIDELRTKLERAPDPHQVEALEEQLADASERIEELEEHLAVRDDELDSVRGQLAERDELIEELEGSLKTRDEKLQRLQDQSVADEASGKDPELQKQLQQKEQELQQLQQEVAEFDEEREKKKAIFAELSGDLRELVASNKELQAKVEELEQELEAARSERDEVLESVDETEANGGASIDGQPSDYQDLVAEKESLEETLAEVILERDRLEDELQKARDAS